MFVGHYGVSLAAKRVSPVLSLGLLFFAVQLLDVLFTIFVLAGVEKMRIVHHFTAYNPYDLYSMPYTHSLAGALVWSTLAAGIWARISGNRLSERERRLGAIVLGAAVFSHFVLDVPMHTPDLPLWPGPDSPKIGLGLWNHRLASILAELAALATGAAIYLRGYRARTRGARLGAVAFFGFLTLLAAATSFQPDPRTPRAFAVRALTLYVLLAVVAGLVDRGRVPEPPAG